nr:ATP-binding protein [Clostridium haemolyticum]
MTITMNYDENFVNIYISDNGQGIPEQDLEKIFQHFYTAHKSLQNKYGGSGLGLAICKEIMNKQSGKIQIESHKGTTVILKFKNEK